MVEGLAVPDDPAPVEIDAGALMDCPDGLVRRGDEFHNPEHWLTCDFCGVECRKSSSACFNCGNILRFDQD